MTCVIPSIPVDTLRDRMGSRAMAERIPLWAHVEIIATCNFKCQHCYIAPCAEREDVMSPSPSRGTRRDIRRTVVAQPSLPRRSTGQWLHICSDPS